MNPLSALKANEKIQVVTLAFLTIFCILIEIILHFYLGISTGYTHFFYIVLVLAAIWYQRKAVILALCLAVTHFSIAYFVFNEPLWVPFLRSAMFVLVTLLVGIMSEGLKKAETEYHNAKEAIHESEEKYRAFFATSKDCVFITSKDGRFEAFNDETPAFFGYRDRKEFGAVNVWDLYLKASERQEHIRAIEQSGFVKDYPVDLRKKDGSIIHALVTSITRKDPLGNVLGFQGTIKDITEHRLAEEALRESERKFRDLFENSRDGIVFADTKTHKFVDSNEMFSLMLGYNSKEIRTLSVSDIHPEDRLSYILDVFEKMMKHEITIVENIPVKRKDGNIFYADISTYPVNISGKGYLAGVFRDITERRKAEEALAQSERKFHTMADFTVDWEYWLAPDSSFVYISPSCEKITGYSPKEFIADPALITRIVHPDDTLLVSDHFNTIHKGPEPGILDFRILGRDGKTHWLAHSCMPVYDRNGTYLGRRASNRDITDRKRAEAALTESFAVFKTVMDSLDALVYVSDMKTYEILFINLYGRKIWGDLTGKICWKSLQENQKGPCPFCTNEKLLDSDGNPAEILIWEFQNTVTGKVYECHDRAIRWTDGRIVRIEIASDITERKQAEAALEESNKRYISYIKEAAMRLKTPVEVVERNITTVIKDINTGDIDNNQVLLQLQIQVKNMEQIRQNILDLNKTIVDGYGEISPASKKFLTE